MTRTLTFMTISAGESAATAQPVLATSDAAAISAALGALLEKIAPDEPETPEAAP